MRKKIHLIRKGTANTLCGLWVDPINEHCRNKIEDAICIKCKRGRQRL